MKKISTALSTILISLLLLGSTAAHITVHNTPYTKSTKLSTVSEGNTLYVGGTGPHNFSSIQQAIDAAQAEDTIYVYPGIYYEHLLLYKPVAIIGESANTTIIDGSSTSSILLINASGVTLKNLHFRNAGGKSNDALIVILQDNTHIQSSFFSSSRTALLADNIENTTITDCHFYHLAAGIHAQSSSYIKCTNCTFTKNGFGILTQQSRYISISNSAGRLNGVTFMMIHSNTITITNCTACKSNENQGGIYAEFSQNIVLENCSVYHNGFGIRLLGCTHPRINTSSVYDCKLGIQLSDSNESTIAHSHIYQCDVGIYLDSSKQVDIHYNSIYLNYVGGLASDHSFANAQHNWWGSPFGILGNMFFRGGWVSVIPPLWSSPDNKTHKSSLQSASPPQIVTARSNSSLAVNNDTDDDGVPDWWEKQYGYDPYAWNNHSSLDPDKDGLNNVEEYLTYEWQSHPFKKDIFVEVDVMDASYKLDQQQKQKMINRFAEHNISLHIDDGSMGGGGEITEKHTYVNYATLSNLYWKYFLHNDPLHWRKGVFRYVILSDSLFKDYPGFVFIGWDEADAFALSIGYYQNHVPDLFRDGVLARVFMHELGHTLGLFHEIFPGIDNQSCIFPFIKGRLVYRNYKSCMNYQYAWRILDYSNGSHGKNDFDDWSHLDLQFFQHSQWQ